MRRVCDHVSVGLMPGGSVLDEGVEREVVRQTSKPLRETIANFEELRHAFVGTDREVDFD